METESDCEDEEEEIPEERISISDTSTELDDELLARLRALKG